MKIVENASTATSTNGDTNPEIELHNFADAHVASKEPIDLLAPYGCEFVRPRWDRILMLHEDRPTYSKSKLIHLPGPVDEKSNKWPMFRVLAIGPDVKGDLLGKPRVGDRVCFQQALQVAFPAFTAWVAPENQMLMLEPVSAADWEAWKDAWRKRHYTLYDVAP